ncbi:hypothetical protein IWW50_005251, partial [Coemansia erecta]
HASIQRSVDTLDAVTCMDVLRDLLSSTCSAVAGFAAELATDILRWLLICAYGSADVGCIGGDAHSQLAAAHVWLQFCVQQIVPADISTASSLRQHAQFLSCFRSCLADAVLAIGTRTSGAAINALAVEDGVLDELLGLVQLAATLDVRADAASSSFFLSFDGASDVLSDHSERDVSVCLGMLVCEALKLLAFVMHGSATYTARFAGIGGYHLVHACVTDIARRSATASAGVAEGVLALLSGTTDPAGCRVWRTLRIDRDWLPTLTALYSQLPLVECISTLRFIAHWCEESRDVRWWWAQCAIARQSIERLQELLIDASCAFARPADRRDCIVAYTR